MFVFLRHLSVYFLTGLFLSPAVYSAPLVQAKDIDKGASIAVSLDFSDNINLSSTDEVSDAVLRVTPGINFKKEGTRVKSSLDYYLSGLLYASETQNNTVRQYMNAYVDSELVEHSVFFDVNASISQQLLNPNRGASIDGVSGSDNLTQTYIYGLTPYWKKNWDSWIDSEVLYNYNEVIYDNSFADNSKQQRMNLQLDSSSKFNEIFWGIDFEHTQTDYDRLPDTSSDVTLLTLGYHYSRKLDLVLKAGYEDYDTPQVTQNSGGTGFSLGIKWYPNTRNSLELDIGKRFFGNTYHLDYKRRARKITWNIAYADDIVDQRTQTRQNVRILEQEPDTPVVPESSAFSRQGQYYLSRNLTNSLIYSYKKSTINWRLYMEKRFYNVSDQENEQRWGTSVNWEYLLSQRTSVDTGVYWDYYDNIFGIANDANGVEIGVGSGERTRTTFLVSLKHFLTRDTSAFARLRIQSNDAERSINDYNENRITIGLQRVF